MLGPCKDPKVRAMFEKIAQLREIWNSESSWDESDYPVPGDDDAQYTPDDDSTNSLTRAPTATSLASTPAPPATPQSVATKESKEDQVVLAEDSNAVLGEDITAEQDKELSELLLEIQKMEGSQWVPQAKAISVHMTTALPFQVTNCFVFICFINVSWLLRNSRGGDKLSQASAPPCTLPASIINPCNQNWINIWAN